MVGVTRRVAESREETRYSVCCTGESWQHPGVQYNNIVNWIVFVLFIKNKISPVRFNGHVQYTQLSLQGATRRWPREYLVRTADKYSPLCSPTPDSDIQITNVVP